ncbi:MAG: LptF/LptG family permease [Phycisphaerales bacterium]|nr:LptF/LptG family permease [Phycisphaerales bacterium]
MKTLYAYFALEMVKSFTLTLIALTLLIVMGGGVASMFSSQGLGADEIGSIFVYLIPVALLYMTPVAALFAATVTFGRAASENEILACKAAGINLHRVLSPSVFAGILAGAITFTGFNFLIPEMAWQVEDITRRDLPKLVANRFLRGKPLIYAKRVAVSAEKCVKIDPKDLPEGYQEGFSFLRLTGVAFQEMNVNELVRIGTADETIIKFDNTTSTPEITLELQHGRSYDAQRRQYIEFDYQLIGPIRFPMAIRRKIQFEKLPTLIDFQAHPIKVPEIDDLMHGMRKCMKKYFLAEVFRDHITKARGGDGRITLKDSNAEITLEASEGFRTDRDNGKIELAGVTAKVSEAGNPIVRNYSAKLAEIKLNDGIAAHSPIIQIELRDDVRYTIEGADAKVVRKPKETLPAVLFEAQDEMQKAFTGFDEMEVLEDDFSIPIFKEDLEKRKKLLKVFRKYNSEIRGEIHFRIAIAVAVLPMVLMGAMLGIILRGGQVLTAVFISCIPGLFVLLAFLIARNFANQPEYGLTPVFIVWGATAILYGGVGVIGFRFLKR